MEAMVRIALLVFGGLVLLAILLDGIKRNREKAAYMRRIDLDLPPHERLNVFDDDEQAAIDAHAKSVAGVQEPAFTIQAESMTPEVTLTEAEVEAEVHEAFVEPAEEPVITLAAPIPVQKPIVAAPKKAISPTFISLSVMGRNGSVFSGKSIMESMHLMGLELDRNGVFQRFANGQPQQGVQFCLVQAVEPGTFDKFTLERLVTPGLTLFMTLPGPRSPMHAFDEMLRAARTLASRLGGEIKNADREYLTNQSLQDYRERIRAVEVLLKETESVE